MTNDQLNYLIDNKLRPMAEEVRALKARLRDVMASPGMEDYSAYPQTADVIQLIRADANLLPDIRQQDMRDFAYQLNVLQSTLNSLTDQVLARFCVRALEV